MTNEGQGALAVKNSYENQKKKKKKEEKEKKKKFGNKEGLSVIYNL